MKRLVRMAIRSSTNSKFGSTGHGGRVVDGEREQTAGHWRFVLLKVQASVCMAAVSTFFSSYPLAIMLIAVQLILLGSRVCNLAGSVICSSLITVLKTVLG